MSVQPGDDATHGGRLGPRSRALGAVLSVLLVAAVVLGALLVRRGPSEAARRDAVLELSREFVLALAQYDHRNLDDEEAEVLSYATGAFRRDYEETFGSPDLRRAIEESESVATAEVAVGPLLADLGPDEARTFTVLEQTIASVDLEEPQVRRVRMELLLVETGSGWKVNAVQLT